MIRHFPLRALLNPGSYEVSGTSEQLVSRSFFHPTSSNFLMAQQLNVSRTVAFTTLEHPTTISLTIHVCDVLMARHSTFYYPGHHMLLEYDDATLKLEGSHYSMVLVLCMIDLTSGLEHSNPMQETLGSLHFKFFLHLSTSCEIDCLYLHLIGATIIF